jgi:hypothetical protein
MNVRKAQQLGLRDGYAREQKTGKKAKHGGAELQSKHRIFLSSNGTRGDPVGEAREEHIVTRSPQFARTCAIGGAGPFRNVMRRTTKAAQFYLM